MPAPSWTSTAANSPPVLAPAAVLNPESGTPSVLTAIVSGDTGLVGTPKINKAMSAQEALGRYGAGAWGVAQGTGELSGSAETMAYTEIIAVIDGPRRVASGSVTLTDAVYNWIYVTPGGTVSKVTQAAATPVPALPNPSVFLGRCRMVAGVLTEIDYSGRQELRGGVLVRRTADTGAPGDTPPASSFFFHRTTAGAYLWDGLSYRSIGRLSGSVTWDPPSVGSGSQTSTTVTVTGAAVGDPVSVGFSTAVPAGALLVGSVTATNTVTVTLLNSVGSPVDLASGTLTAVVFKS